MKKRMLVVIAFVLTTIFMGCLIVYLSEITNNLDSTRPMLGVNDLWDDAGNKVTVTEVETVESYIAPDGTEYIPLTGEKLFVVKCNTDLQPGWELSFETFLALEWQIPLLCPIILEKDKFGDVKQVLLFDLPENQSSDHATRYIYMRLYIRSGEKEKHEFFAFPISD